MVLRVLGQDLEALRQQVLTHLADDIAHLQARKQRLMADIEALEGDYETLQTQHQRLQSAYSEALTQQQIAQQQAWAKRLAVALATHLQGRLEAALAQANPIALQAANAQDAIAPLSAASQGLAALDATLQTTLASLQQDLTSYHSGISQQISRMQNVEQQGEAILEALVARLSQQLQSQMVPPPATRNGYGVAPPVTNGALYGTGGSPTNPTGSREPLPGPALPLRTYRGPVQPSPVQSGWGQSGGGATGSSGSTGVPSMGGTPLVPRPQPHPDREDPDRKDNGPSPQNASDRPVSTYPQTGSQMGIVVVVLSTLALSLHNVIVGVIGYGGQLLGRIPVEAVLPLTIPNSMLLLWLRMVVVVPLLALLAPRLHPHVRDDLRQLFSRDYRRPLIQVVASGGFLFLSQVLIYKAISDVGPGVAVTLLFMYPLITVPLAWFLFGDRPTSLRLVVMFAISMGIVFTALPRIYTDLSGNGVSLWGVGAALLSSVAFALFLISMQLCFRRLHPVSVSLLQFCTIFILTSLILIVGFFFGLTPGAPTSALGLYVGAGLLGLLTLLGYLFNNYGVKLLGAAQASIVAASGPVVTAILAYLITPGEKSTLLFIQWMGVILVTLGVISLSLERLTNQRRQARKRTAVPTNTGQWP
jgi:drug/metabolite transporter (DMT)-like permease/predicted  nucleic acid-binding Zn-ribbon protein